MVPILVGVFVPRTANAARFLREQVPGIDVPEPVIERMDGVPPERQPEEGIKIATEIVQEVRDLEGIRGVHLMAIRNEAGIERVLQEAGLLPRPQPVESLAVG
jgi:methylenetetrahydrofolate reductase (NADPH)